ncbi:MAG: T9SS type A sorting domain-containing protein [Bacteroidales bacterium]|nr:T9SS type A sorting domain-containing protein [Bacteroidales bacterium]
MKKVIFYNTLILFLLMIGHRSFSQGSWEKVYVPTSQYLKSVFFVDSLHGWIVGDSGIILHTADGGNNWEFQESGTENEIFSVFFLDNNRGWASSFDFSSLPYHTDILSTTDGGESWSSNQYPEDDTFITCILFLDSLTGWMGGMPHALVKTTDGGGSWEQAAIDTTVLAFFPVLNITFYDENHGFAAGGMFDIAGTMWRTGNGGNLWTPVDAAYAPADEVHGVHMFDPQNIIAAGGDPDFGYGVAIMKSSDGGDTWNYEELGFPGNAYDLDFRNETDAWCPLGPRRKLIYSMDGGDTWGQVETPDSTAIFELCFPDSLHGFGVGQEGAVIRYKPPVPTFVEQEKLSSGFQIFPNPTFGFTNFSFEIETVNHESKSELVIHDNKGKVVFRKIVDIATITDRVLQMDLSHLEEGMYYFCLLSEGKDMVFSGKIVKIR